MTAGASRREPAGEPGDRQPEPDDRAEDEEEPQVGGRRDAAATDDHDLARVDGERPATTAGDEPDQPDAGRQPRRARTREPERRRTPWRRRRRGPGSSRLGRIGRRRRGSTACGVASSSSRSRRRPSDRAAMARIATAPPSVATRPAVRSSSSASGVPPRPVRTSSAPLEQQAEADPDPQDVAAGDDRHDGERGQREPGRRRERRTGRRRPEPVAAVADDRRRRGEERVGRPADQRAAGPQPRSRASRPTGGSRRGSPPTRRAARPSDAGSGSARTGAPTIVTTRPRIAVRAFRADPATRAPTTTASATPARAGFTAARSLGRSEPAPGRWASGGCRSRRAASSAATRGR